MVPSPLGAMGKERLLQSLGDREQAFTARQKPDLKDSDCVGLSAAASLQRGGKAPDCEVSALSEDSGRDASLFMLSPENAMVPDKGSQETAIGFPPSAQRARRRSGIAGKAEGGAAGGTQI